MCWCSCRRTNIAQDEAPPSLGHFQISPARGQGVSVSEGDSPCPSAKGQIASTAGAAESGSPRQSGWSLIPQGSFGYRALRVQAMISRLPLACPGQGIGEHHLLARTGKPSTTEGRIHFCKGRITLYGPQSWRPGTDFTGIWLCAGVSFSKHTHTPLFLSSPLPQGVLGTSWPLP